MPQIKIVPTKEYKEARDAAPEAIRWELEDLETELRRNRLTPGRKPENIRCRSGEALHAYRVNRDWRIIAYHWKEDEIILLFAGAHDEAYRQACALCMEGGNGLPVISTLPSVTYPETLASSTVPQKARGVKKDCRAIVLEAFKALKAEAETNPMARDKAIAARLDELEASVETLRQTAETLSETIAALRRELCVKDRSADIEER